jgi:hypothetical protein
LAAIPSSLPELDLSRYAMLLDATKSALYTLHLFTVQDFVTCLLPVVSGSSFVVVYDANDE